jgi:hypothetical protein
MIFVIIGIITTWIICFLALIRINRKNRVGFFGKVISFLIVCATGPIGVILTWVYHNSLR